MADSRLSDGALPVDYRLDDYRIVAVLGQGGFGVTYKAIDERLERMVALKEYLPRQFAVRDSDATVHARSDADAETFEWGRRRFIDEARALAKFKHPNIVAVIRYLEANGTAYLVMEYEEGRDFEKWLLGRSEPPTEDLIVGRILLPVLDGLEKIHDQGLLHRDIKPENIFIRRDGSPVVIDFGASRPRGSGSAPMTSIISAGYSPFEQYGAGEGQGPWSDLYALCGTMYRALVGNAPADAISRFQGTPLIPATEAARGRYSPALLGAIDRGLALNAAERPQSAKELRALLGGAQPAAVADGGATRVRSAAETVVAGGGKGTRRGGFRVGLVAMVGVALVAAAAGGYYFYSTYSTTDITDDAAVSAEAPAVSPPAGVGTKTDDPVAGPAEPVPAQSSEASPEEVATAVVEQPAVPSENDIVKGLPLSEGDRAYRVSQIGGALLAYVSNRQKFDDCLKSGCAEQVTLMTKVQEALDGYEWSQGQLAGELKVTNPRRTQREDCPYLLDIVETLRGAGEVREQTRSYCTTNGFDRALQSAGPIVET